MQLVSTRLVKAALVAAIALYFGLVVLGNMLAPAINYAFVQHVLSMDSIPDNPLIWRAIRSPLLWKMSYALIIGWECLCMGLTALAAWRLARAARHDSPLDKVLAAQRFAAVAIGAGLALWLVGFITIGGEWFQMWESHTWNGLDAAFRNFAMQLLILLYVSTPEPA